MQNILQFRRCKHGSFVRTAHYLDAKCFIPLILAWSDSCRTPGDIRPVSQTVVVQVQKTGHEQASFLFISGDTGCNV